MYVLCICPQLANKSVSYCNSCLCNLVIGVLQQLQLLHRMVSVNRPEIVKLILVAHMTRNFVKMFCCAPQLARTEGDS